MKFCLHYIRKSSSSFKKLYANVSALQKLESYGCLSSLSKKSSKADSCETQEERNTSLTSLSKDLLISLLFCFSRKQMWIVCAYKDRGYLSSAMLSLKNMLSWYLLIDSQQIPCLREYLSKNIFNSFYRFNDRWACHYDFTQRVALSLHATQKQ